MSTIQKANGRTTQSSMWDTDSIYNSISKLKKLEPSTLVNRTFSKLYSSVINGEVIINSSLDKLDLIREIVSIAESKLEKFWAKKIIADPMTVYDFPYYNNYEKLVDTEIKLVKNRFKKTGFKLIFIGGGALPLTPIVWATKFKNAQITVIDSDKEAIELARGVVEEIDIKNIKFINSQADEYMQYSNYDIVYLAALVGLNKNEKSSILHHLHSTMTKGTLIVRSASGSRKILYPEVDYLPDYGFNIVSTFHPTGDIVNSTIVAEL